MKNTILIISMFFLSFVTADGHLKSEQDVLASLEKYFEARNNNDYETVVAFESKTGTYGTNSDGSFHKPRQIPSVEQWKKFDQGGVTSVFYPEAIQLSEGVVLTRFYLEGVVTGDYASIGQDGEKTVVLLYKNGSEIKSGKFQFSNQTGRHGREITVIASGLFNLSASDTIELYAYLTDVDGGSATVQSDRTSLMGYKIIE